MDFELWWLITIPAVFALGWVAARLDFRHLMSEARTLPDSYFRGLNFLLNEQPDRAIDAFIEVTKLDPETTELHFALGNLFRRRGEIERAIRVHQNLLQRADLSAIERDHACYELAQDFLRAGMLDRAESGFRQLMGTRYQTDALRYLLRVFEIQRNWFNAIETAARLMSEGQTDVALRAAHFHCELAQSELLANPPNLQAAERALVQALRLSQHHVRTRILLAEVFSQAGEVDTAATTLEELLTTAPEYAGIFAQRFLELMRHLGRLEVAYALLTQHFERYHSLDLFDVLFQAQFSIGGAQAALAFSQRTLQQMPSLLVLDRLLEAQLAVGTDQDNQVDGVRNLVHRHTQRLGRYVCQACGFKAQRFHWHCPGCNAWETYLPKRLEELEN